MPALNHTVLVDEIISGEKRQTIRSAGRRKYKAGDRLFHYTGMRTKSCRKFGESICREVVCVTFTHAQSVSGHWNIYVGNFFMGPGPEMLDFAHQDGFKNIEEFQAFFLPKLNRGESKEMNIIKWRDFKPSEEQ